MQRQPGQVPAFQGGKEPMLTVIPLAAAATAAYLGLANLVLRRFA